VQRIGWYCDVTPKPRQRILPLRYEQPPAPQSPIGRIIWSLILVVVLAAASLHFFNPSSARTSDAKLAWPKTGEAAIGIVGSGVLETHADQTARPTASTAKLITALTILKKYPLQPGQSGPTLTMSRSDIELMISNSAQNGSEIGKIFVGEQLSEYQMLQAMMLPSANNMADSLAVWAYGSLPAYAAAANNYLASLGLHDTHVGIDASGLDPSTVSTAHDLVILGELAMQNRVLAEIVATPSVNGFPLVGTITNVNTLLGQDGIVGVKTGNSDEAGGVFVFAAEYTKPDGKKLVIVGAVQGLRDLQAALQATKPLLHSAEQSIDQGKLVATH